LKTTKLLNNHFNLLDQKQDRYLLIIIVFVFSVAFLNLFVPFNINRWYSDSGIIQFLRLSSYGFVVALVFLFTQFPLRKWLKQKQFRIKYYISWLLIEITLISLVYMFLYGNPVGNFMNDFIFSIRYTVLGIIIPYSFALLIIYYKNQRAEINLLRKNIKMPSTKNLLQFRDEKNRIKFSVLASNLLYLEGADNYVYVFYAEKGKVKRDVLRNSLKNMEESLKPESIVRCHRSYMINSRKIESVKNSGKRIYLKLIDTSETIPVSSRYQSLFQ
jgi:hypothetical protein